MVIETREHARKSSTSMGAAGALAAIAAAAITFAPASSSAQYPPPPPPQGYDQPPPGYVPQSVAMSGPRVIKDWEEGEPIPAGYHPVTRMRTGLVVGGAVTFGVVYLLGGILPATIGTEAKATELTPLFAPVVGPFITMGTIGNATGTATARVFLAIDGLAQAAGVAMLIAGLAAPKTVLIRNDLGKVKVMPTPMTFGKNSNGFGFVGTF